MLPTLHCTYVLPGITIGGPRPLGLCLKGCTYKQLFLPWVSGIWPALTLLEKMRNFQLYTAQCITVLHQLQQP